jgi:hypothetical protein
VVRSRPCGKEHQTTCREHRTRAGTGEGVDAPSLSPRPKPRLCVRSSEAAHLLASRIEEPVAAPGMNWARQTPSPRSELHRRPAG